MRRVLLGERNAGEYGLWVSKPSKDVYSTNTNDFLLSPTFNVCGAALTGFFGTTLNLVSDIYGGHESADAYGDIFVYDNVIYSITIAHGLGYTPILYTDIQPTDNAVAATGYAGGFIAPDYLVAACDSTNVGLTLTARCMTAYSSPYVSYGPPPSTALVNRAIHFAVMGIQIG